jgi:hypothetical protein
MYEKSQNLTRTKPELSQNQTRTKTEPNQNQHESNTQNTIQTRFVQYELWAIYHQTRFKPYPNLVSNGPGRAGLCF